MQPAFDFVDLRCFADPSDARTYYFLPIVPDLRRDSRHHPLITMIDVGSSGSLMFTAAWDANADTVEALRGDIARGHHEPDASRIKLVFAPLTSLECHALLGDGRGSFQTIATSATSGMPPYDALFSLAVTSERLGQVRSAMRGEPGFLAIEYVAALLLPSTATAAFRSQTGDLLSWLRTRHASGEPMRVLLEQAVESGLATVTIDASDRVDDQVTVELFDRVLSQAAQVVPQWVAEGGHGTIEVQIALEREAREPVRAFADVGGIVASGSARPS